MLADQNICEFDKIHFLLNKNLAIMCCSIYNTCTIIIFGDFYFGFLHKISPTF